MDPYTPSYLTDALGSLDESRKKRANKIYESSGGRYSIDNADQANSWDGRWLAADNERARQLGMLQTKLTDPALLAGIERQANTQRDAVTASASSQHRQATGSLRSSMAAKGTAGGGLDAQLTAQNDAILQAAKARAQSMADEARAAGITGLRGIEKSLVDRILAEDDNGAYGSALDSQQTGIRAGEMNRQLEDEYGGLLSNTLAGFVGNTVQPFVSGGFDAADRANQANQDTANPSNYTWWNAGNTK
jgi:hypothetical protein